MLFHHCLFLAYFTFLLLLERHLPHELLFVIANSTSNFHAQSTKESPSSHPFRQGCPLFVWVESDTQYRKLYFDSACQQHNNISSRELFTEYKQSRNRRCKSVLSYLNDISICSCVRYM
jgi:hypothetical protein